MKNKIIKVSIVLLFVSISCSENEKVVMSKTTEKIIAKKSIAEVEPHSYGG